MSPLLKFGIVAGCAVLYAAFVMAGNRTESRPETFKLMLVWFRNAVGAIAIAVFVVFLGAALNPITQ